MTNRYTSLFAAGLVALAGCTAEEPATKTDDAAVSAPVAVEMSGGNPAAEEAVEQITDEYMREIIAEISSDAYEGRGPGAAGDEKTRAYLIGRMEELGLDPGGADVPNCSFPVRSD